MQRPEIDTPVIIGHHPFVTMPYVDEVREQMTRERAERVRELRRTHTWRALARDIHAEWGDDATWTPSSNQLAGMALTQVASEVLGINIDASATTDEEATP